MVIVIALCHFRDWWLYFSKYMHI